MHRGAHFQHQVDDNHRYYDNTITWVRVSDVCFDNLDRRSLPFTRRGKRVKHNLVHGSHLKQKKFTNTKSLGITPPYLVRQPVNTPLICQIRGDITMSFRCDHALKQFAASPRSTSICPLSSASAPYLVELGSRELTNTWSSAISRREVIVKSGGMTVPGGRKCLYGIFEENS